MPLKSASELDVFTFRCSSSLATMVKMSDDPTQQVDLPQSISKRQGQAGSSGDENGRKRQKRASGRKDMPATETASSDNDMQATAGSSGDNDMQERAGTPKTFNCWQLATVRETAQGKMEVLEHHPNIRPKKPPWHEQLRRIVRD